MNRESKIEQSFLSQNIWITCLVWSSIILLLAFVRIYDVQQGVAFGLISIFILWAIGALFIIVSGKMLNKREKEVFNSNVIIEHQDEEFSKIKVKHAENVDTLEKKYNQLLNNTPNGCIITDKNGLVKFINKSFESFFHTTEDQLVNKLNVKNYTLFEEAGISKAASDLVDDQIEFESEIVLHFSNETFYLHTYGKVLSNNDEHFSNMLLFINITKRKLAEIALMQREELFRSLFKNSIVGFYRTTPNGRILWANPALVKMLGYDSFEEMSERNLEESNIYTKYPRDEFKKIMEEKGKVIRFEQVWLRKDNTPVNISENATALYNSKNEIVYYDGVIEDISDRVKMEKEVAFQTEFAKSIAKISTNFVELDINHIENGFAYATRFLLQFLQADRCYVVFFDGVTRQMKVMQESTEKDVEPVSDIFNDFPQESYNWINNQLYDEGIRYKKEIDFEEMTDQNTTDFMNRLNLKSFIAVPILLDKQSVGFTGIEFVKKHSTISDADMTMFELYSEIINNVYKSYVSEIARQSIEDKMRRMTYAVEQSVNLIIITDIDGNIDYVNPKFETVTGYTFDEVIGKNPRFLKSGKTTLEEYKKLWTTIIKGEIWTGEFKNKKKNGDIYWEHATISPIKNNEGIITNFLAIKEDISEKILVENQLNLSQKMESIGQLAAGIAHEINTPMQYVGDNANFLHDSYDAMMKIFFDFNAYLEDGNDYSNDEIREFYQQKKEEMDLDFIFEEVPEALEQTHTGIQRVTKIVRAMKNFAHPGAKEKTFHDLNKGIENTVIISKNEWKYVAEVDLNLDEKLTEVYCLQDELNQVFLNMIVNAAQAIEEKMGKTKENEKGKISIETAKQNGHAVIKISDTGTGIKKENINRVYDPFFTTKEVGKGTGQGLAIVHDIITNKHKGKIEVESEAGNGTTFIIRIPIGRN